MKSVSATLPCPLYHLKMLMMVMVVATVVVGGASSSLGRRTNRKHSKWIEGSMDVSADPCEDFYQYACGKWEQLQHRDSDYEETISMVDYNTNVQLARSLRWLNFHGKPRFVRQASAYYRACALLEQYQPLEYLKLLNQREDLNLYSSHHKDRNHYDWVRLLAVLRRYGMNGVFLEETLLQRRDNASLSLVDLDKPVLNGGFQPLTFEQLQLIFAEMPLPLSPHTLYALWDVVHLFELRLQRLDEIEDDDDYQLVSVKSLGIPWIERYLSIVLEQQPLDPHMEFYIQNVPYMHALYRLLAKHDSRFICKYLEIRFLWYLHSEGPTNFTPEECAAHTRGMLPLAMHWIFEMLHPELTEETPNVEALFHQMIRQFASALAANANRFAPDVMAFLLTKVANMHLKVGNLPRPNTIQILEEFYKELHMNASDFYANHLEALLFATRAAHRRLHSSISPNAAEMFHLETAEAGASSSPYYLQRSNVVVVPLSLLQRPIYHSQLDDVFKYSSLGFLLAHEIVHGFDVTGIEVDHRGNMISSLADVIISNGRFDANLRCLRRLDPTVIDEKIADISGLRLSYEAYFQTHPDAAAQTRRLYGVDLSMAKVFFLNFAQFFCGSSTPDESMVDTSEHGSDRDRVLDALAHFDEFARTYRCPVGTRLHPPKRCNLWR